MKLKTYCIAAIALMPITAPPPVVPTPPAGATVAADDSSHHPFVDTIDTVKPEVANSAYWDFDTRSLADSTPIDHHFVIHNNSAAPVSIGRVQAACGCTIATPDNGLPGAYKPVEPGKDLTIDVSIDPGHLYAGSIDKIVWVYLVGQTDAAYTLHVTGTMNAAATFSPTVLNFGTVRSGDSPSKLISITIDTTSYGANPPDPITTNADMIISASHSSDPSDAHHVTRVYTVQLSKKAHIGAIQATIAMPKKDGHVLAGPNLFVTGVVVGDVTAAPQSVAFGTLNVGHAATQEIVLTGTTSKTFKGLTVRCDDPNLKAKITSVKAQTAVLEVAFSPSKVGSLQSQVRVVTKNGQELDLPVWAWVNN